MLGAGPEGRTMANLSVRRGEPRQEAAVWDPFRMMDPMRSFDPMRLIRDIMGVDPFAGLVTPGGGTFAPDIEIKETKDAYVICADLPGVKTEDLEVSMTGNRLTVSGTRSEEKRREDDRFFAYERAYGTFSRSFVLPEGTDLDRLRADLQDGVLRVEVPKKAEMQPRRIEVGGKEGSPPRQEGKAEVVPQKGEPKTEPQKKAA
jgi:HSP20 family protein